ncbi:Bor/Iss family lipoprotein [Arenicella chitinivorans]|nr:hypothetical protein [Arenicella chitinivorans]
MRPFIASNHRKSTAVFVAFALCVLSGCSTIEFVQHEQSVESKSVNRWHHSTLNGMVEISKPLNIESICGKRAWTTVTTEFTLLNALPVVLVPSTSLVSFYSAWTNKVNCYEVPIGDYEQAESLTP